MTLKCINAQGACESEPGPERLCCSTKKPIKETMKAEDDEMADAEGAALLYTSRCSCKPFVAPIPSIPSTAKHRLLLVSLSLEVVLQHEEVHQGDDGGRGRRDGRRWGGGR